MAKPRKTEAERRDEWAARARIVWYDFTQQLAAVNNLVEMFKLAAISPPVDTPGRHYYSNYKFFLGDFGAPASATRDELVLYAELLARLDAAGQLRPGAGARCIASLEASRLARFGE